MRLLRGNCLYEIYLRYEQTSLGIRKRCQAFDVHPKDDMRLRRVDPLMCGYMYVVEAVVRRQALPGLEEVENQALTVDIVYMQIDGLVNGRALIHNSLAPYQG